MVAARHRGKALIVGGSMAGLFAALHLLKRGWDVQLFERVPGPLSGRGAGIVAHQELFDALAAVGIAWDDRLGLEVPGRVAYDRDGGVVGRRDLRQIVTAWGRLHRALDAHMPAERRHRGREIVRVEQDAQSVRAHFADGRVEQADLLVGADGFRSTVRAQFAAEQPDYVGYVAWRGLVRETELSERVRRDLLPYFAFCLPPGEQALGYPVAGEDEAAAATQNRRYNFVWYRPADAQTRLPWMLTDIDGRRDALSIAPGRIRPEVVDEMRAAAERLLAPQFAELVRRIEHPFIQPIYDLTVQRMAFGRVALVGDSAFVARPHVGMGVTKAAADAVALADALDRSEGAVAPALQVYEAARRPVGEAVVRRARRLGAYLQAHRATAAEQDAAAAHGSAQSVMIDTATSDFLRAQS